MKSNIPWSVKGIDPEAREAAKVAARRAGMTLGEWLNSLILQSGELPEGFAEHMAAMADDDEDPNNNPEAPNFQGGGEGDDLTDRLDSLNRRLDQSERQSAMAVSGIDQSIERLANTIENSRRMVVTGDNVQKSAVNELNSRIDRIQSQLEEIAQHSRTGIEPRTLMALERAIAGVAGHIEKSDRRNAELVRTVEDTLSEFAKRSDNDSVASEGISRLDLALDRLAGRLDTAESEHRRASTRLNERLSQIDDRLAQAASERESSLSMVDRRLSGFESRLQTMQSRVDSAVNARPNLPPDLVTRGELEDWSRRNASDQSSGTAMVRRSVAEVEARLAGLIDRIDRMRQDTEHQLRALDRKADEAMRAAERQPAWREEHNGEAVTALQHSIDDVGQRFERANHTATETMSALEEVLRSLTRRIDDLEERATEAPPAEAEPEPEPEAPPRWSWQNRHEPDEPAVPRYARTSELERGLPPYARPSVQAEPEPAEIVEEAAAEDAEVVAEEEGMVEATFSGDSETFNLDEPAEEPDDPQGERQVDLSKLKFNLNRESEPDRADEPVEEHRTLRERIARASSNVIEDTREPSEGGGWLEQARRAAKTAARGERSTDFALDDEQRRGPARALAIGAGVIVLLLIMMALAWFVVRPWLEDQGFIGTPTPATEAPPATSAPPRASEPAPTVPAPSETGSGERSPIGTETPEGEAPAALAPGEAVAPEGEELAPGEEDLDTPLEGAEPGAQAEEPAATEEAEAAPTAEEDTAAEPPSTPEEALAAAATGGDPKAQFSLGLFYKSEGDIPRALNWMTKAAEQDLAVAQRTLGIWYEQGDGVDKDIRAARNWYEKAAGNGDVQSMHNLAYFFSEGLGGLTKSGATAEKWFKNAAEKGLVASQYNLAIIYSQGAAFGIETQPEEAYRWSSIAASRGDQEAANMRNLIGPSIDPVARGRIDTEVASWKPGKVNLDALGGFDTSADAFMPGARAELTKSELESVQELLNGLGYDAGEPDGRPGAQTEAAIRSFQEDYGLTPTGKADKNLLAALNAVPH